MITTTILSPNGKLTLTPKEASELMGISLPKMYEFLHQEHFPKVKNGRTYIIPYAAFVEWINDKMTE